MLALVFDGTAKLRRDYPAPIPAANDVLVAVTHAGVCSTDLEILKGYMGFTGVLGHEFVGRVVRGPSLWMDKRVVGEINCICNKCAMCKRGLGSHCLDRGVLGIYRRDGVFAELLSLPVQNLHEVPANVSDDAAVFVEPLAAAYQILTQIQINPADEVVVLGGGRLGQMVVRALKNACPTLTLVSRGEEKLKAAARAGVRTVKVSDFTPASQADVVVDATGSPQGFELAMRTVRPRGTIVLKSTTAAGAGGLNLAPLVINEVTVIGSRCGPFDRALRALASGEVDLTGLISRRFALADGLAALEAAKQPGNIKVVIDVQ